ncbi:MAG: hypothetical protein HKN04_06715 [Rhodothermaceae bacterium]|nr:hypothetical protein [Rhodothermaceae bacterium]
MNPSRAALLFALSALVIGCTGADDLRRSSMLGVWSGEVTEGAQRYELAMTIRQLEVGQAAGAAMYSGALSCVGMLTFEGERDGALLFREAIDDATVCADDGLIAIRPGTDGTLQWAWYRTDADPQPDAVAVLRRQ